MSEVDLVSRAALALRCLTALTDEANAAPPYVLLLYDRKPAEAWHIFWDYGDCLGRYADALALARIMTGSEMNRRVEEDIWRHLLGTIGSDGLSWTPGVPWLADDNGPPCAEVGWCQRGALMAFIDRHLLTGERVWAQRINRLIETLLRIGQGAPDYLYFPGRLYYPDGWRQRPEPVDLALPPWASHDRSIDCWNGSVAYPAARWHQLTGDERAAELARRMVRFIREQTTIFAPDGSFIAGSQETTHFASRSAVALAALRLGITTHDDGLVDWARGVYRAALEMGSDFGFFPERIHTMRHCETCCVTDMIEMAILLAQHGDTRHWADAERFGKNQLLANQVVDVGWLARVPDRKENQPSHHPTSARGDHLLATRLGGFAISARVHDLVDVHHPEYYSFSNCCHGSGARALYDLWHYAIEELPSEIRVHMHFSRKTPAIEVRCQEGAEGRLAVNTRCAKRIAVRRPEFCSAADLAAQVDGRPASLRESQGYLYWDQPRPGQELILRFHNRPRETAYRSLSESYRVFWIGNRVVGVEPKGAVCPLYEGPVELPSALAYRPPPGSRMTSEIDTV